MEYKLENGDEIKVGECYRTRDGRKVFISKALLNKEERPVIYGMILDEYISRIWSSNGCAIYLEKCTTDLISLWEPKEEKLDKKYCGSIHAIGDCKLCRKEEIKITDEMIIIAARVYKKHFTNTNYPIESMEVALRAVFNHIVDVGKKVEDDGWIEHYGQTMPNIGVDQIVEVKFRNDAIGKARVACVWNWDVNISYPDHDIIAYRILKDKEPNHIGGGDKKLYRLSEMWKGWRMTPTALWATGAFRTKEDLLEYNHPGELIAITRADATEFYEGEGLDD